MSDKANSTIDRVAREHYGRLIAYLAAGSNDLARAEDALSDAFAKALEVWPAQGIPNSPEAWLLTTARRKLIDDVRRSRVHHGAIESIAQALQTRLDRLDHCSMNGPDDGEELFRDERLKLMFVCAHPAIDESIRAPLMLQTVLGINSATIASAMLIPPTTMGQRLSRAKRKILETKIPFRVPEQHELAERLGAVLECIYAAFGLGWDEVVNHGKAVGQLAREAVWLARITTELLPDEPEAMGLLTLLLFCDARRSERRTAEGQYVPFNEQRTERWDHGSIDEAESLLHRAITFNRIGPYQLEAAIQSAHINGRLTGTSDWNAITHLYEGLLQLSPTVGVLIGHAAAVAESRDSRAAIKLLDAIDPAFISNHLPYWALRAELATRTDDNRTAETFYQRAIGLAEDSAVRKFLIEKMIKLRKME